MLLVRRGVSVEVATFVVIVLLDVEEAGRALSQSLEAGETRHVTMRVYVDVLHVGTLDHCVILFLLFFDLFTEHLELLLVLLNAHFDAVDQNFSVDYVLRGRTTQELFGAQHFASRRLATVAEC